MYSKAHFIMEYSILYIPWSFFDQIAKSKIQNYRVLYMTQGGKNKIELKWGKK